MNGASHSVLVLLKTEKRQEEEEKDVELNFKEIFRDIERKLGVGFKLRFTQGAAATSNQLPWVTRQRLV